MHAIENKAKNESASHSSNKAVSNNSTTSNHSVANPLWQQLVGGVIQRKPQSDKQQADFNPDEEYSKPPQMDNDMATKLAVMQVVEGASKAGLSGQESTVASNSTDESQGTKQYTLEELLNQPDLRKVLRQMANDLGYIVNLYPPGEMSSAVAKEFKEYGVKGTLIDAVAIAAFELGIFESAGVAHKKLMEGIKGIPAKAVEAVLNKLLSLGQEAASNGPTSPYGPELTAYEGFPIVGSMEFEMDFSPAPAMKAIPHLRFRGGNIGGRINPNEKVAVDFTVVWPEVRKDKTMPDGERRVMEKWRIDVLAASGAYQVGLPGLKGWTGFSQYIQPYKDSGILRFAAPSLPGMYQARLVNSEGVKAKVEFRVAGSD